MTRFEIVSSLRCKCVNQIRGQSPMKNLDTQGFKRCFKIKIQVFYWFLSVCGYTGWTIL